MSKGVVVYLPSHDDQPGAEIAWAADCRDAFNRGVKLAQSWLDSACGGWLWAVMIAERDLLPRAIDRRAFEVGFLGRVHQRLHAHSVGSQSAAGAIQIVAQPQVEAACR